ncbi:MAG: OB-fold nucleic acid binding domain-containing protein, partial [Candidatus Saliniplasma sp.]
MKRIHSTDAVELEDGEKCKMAGWLQEVKNLGGIAFLKVRDREDVFQVVLVKEEIGEEEFDDIV